MNSKILGVALIAQFLSLSSHSAMRCDRAVITEGSSTYDVVSSCGEPVFQETILQPITTYRQAYIQSQPGYDSQGLSQTQGTSVEVAEPEYRQIQRWTFDLGSGTLLREVDFYNGKVIDIRTTRRAN